MKFVIDCDWIQITRVRNWGARVKEQLISDSGYIELNCWNIYEGKLLLGD